MKKPALTLVPPILVLPKVGDTIYVNTAWYLSHGADDFNGGRAVVSEVDRNGYVSIRERPGHSYNWEHLGPLQKELKKEFGDRVAHPDPDNSPEANDGW